MKRISKNKLRLLKKYFLENPEVSMAFLFGSQVKGQALFDSDVGIADFYYLSVPLLWILKNS
jgi:predicted nucleotidyltransferase